MVGRRSGYPMSGEATRQPTALGNGVRHAPPFCPGGDQVVTKYLRLPLSAECGLGLPPGEPARYLWAGEAAGASLKPPPGTWPSTEIQSHFTWGTRLLVCQENLDPVAERQDKIHKATCFEASRFHRRHFTFTAQKGCVKWSRDCPRPCPASVLDPEQPPISNQLESPTDRNCLTASQLSSDPSGPAIPSATKRPSSDVCRYLAASHTAADRPTPASPIRIRHRVRPRLPHSARAAARFRTRDSKEWHWLSNPPRSHTTQPQSSYKTRMLGKDRGIQSCAMTARFRLKSSPASWSI